MKHILQSWSGGLDSTYLLHQNLEQGNTVTAVYFEIKNNSTKVIREHDAINQMLPYFKEKYDKRFNFVQNAVSTNIMNDNINLSLSQPPIWLFSLIYSIESITDEVHIGYVEGDSANSFIPEIQTIWNSYKGLMQDNSMPPLKFPLIKTNKSTILYNIPISILKYVTWCNKYLTKVFHFI